MEVNSPFRAIITFKPSSEADSQNWFPVAGVGGWWSLVNAHNTTHMVSLPPAHLLQAISYSYLLRMLPQSQLVSFYWTYNVHTRAGHPFPVKSKYFINWLFIIRHINIHILLLLNTVGFWTVTSQLQSKSMETC